MSLADSGSEYIAVAGKATPPLAVTGGLVAGLPLQDWVLIATLIYTVVQTVFLIVDRYKKYKNGR